MLLGNYEFKIDDKGRLAIPAKLRKEFAGGVLLSQGLGKYVIAYPLAEWENIVAQYSASPFARSKARRMNRFIFATAFDAELDAQGRVILPTALRQYAEIGDEVVIAGAGTYLEIWAKEHWLEEKALFDEHAWQIAEGMESAK